MLTVGSTFARFRQPASPRQPTGRLYGVVHAGFAARRGARARRIAQRAADTTARQRDEKRRTLAPSSRHRRTSALRSSTADCRSPAMATREKERLEKALEALRKLPENKNCVDCTGAGARGPQYVVLNTHLEHGLGSFVCTPCSSAHREVSNRCKGVSASVFSAEEIDFLKAHGNEASGDVQPWFPCSLCGWIGLAAEDFACH